MSLVNRERLAEYGRAAGVDVVVATRRDNVRYLADMPDDLAVALDLPIAVIARLEPFELIALLAPRGMAGLIPERLKAPAVAVWLYGGFYALGSTHGFLEPHEAGVEDLLGTAPGQGASFEEALGRLVDTLPASTRLAMDTPEGGPVAIDARRGGVADGSRLLRDVRQVKSPEEVARLQRAATVAEAVEQEIIDGLAPGIDWADLARSVPAAVARQGGTFGFMTGGAGWQGGFIHTPRPMPLAAGHLVRLDLGLTVDGYWSDTGRSVSIGPPSAETMERYTALRSGADAALERIRPGARYHEAYDAAMRAIRRAIPAYERHHCGHAIGLRAYDGPLVGPGDQTVFEPGMVVNVEVPLYAIGWGGLQLEDTILVERDGFRSLTRLDRGLFVAAV